MGNGQSSLKKKNNKFTIDQKDLNVLNQAVNSTVVNKIIDYSSVCSAAINNSQEIKMEKIHADGDLTVDNTQKQMIILDFKCVDKIKVIDESIENNLTKIMNEFHKVNKSVAGEIEQKAKDIVKAQHLATNPDKSTVNINIETVVSDILHVNITNKVINECFIKMGNYQNVLIKNVRGEEVNAVIEQEQAVVVMGECINSLNIGQNIIGNIIQKFDIVVENPEIKIPTDIKLPPSAATPDGWGGWGGWDGWDDWDDPLIPTSPTRKPSIFSGNSNLIYTIVGLIVFCCFVFSMLLILVSENE